MSDNEPFIDIPGYRSTDSAPKVIITNEAESQDQIELGFGCVGMIIGFIAGCVSSVIWLNSLPKGHIFAESGILSLLSITGGAVGGTAAGGWLLYYIERTYRLSKLPQEVWRSRHETELISNRYRTIIAAGALIAGSGLSLKSHHDQTMRSYPLKVQEHLVETKKPYVAYVTQFGRDTHLDATGSKLPKDIRMYVCGTIDKQGHLLVRLSYTIPAANRKDTQWKLGNIDVEMCWEMDASGKEKPKLPWKGMTPGENRALEHAVFLHACKVLFDCRNAPNQRSKKELLSTFGIENRSSFPLNGLEFHHVPNYSEFETEVYEADFCGIPVYLRVSIFEPFLSLGCLYPGQSYTEWKPITDLAQEAQEWISGFYQRFDRDQKDVEQALQKIGVEGPSMSFRSPLSIGGIMFFPDQEIVKGGLLSIIEHGMIRYRCTLPEEMQKYSIVVSVSDKIAPKGTILLIRDMGNGVASERPIESREKLEEKIRLLSMHEEAFEEILFDKRRPKRIL